ncbi:MAG: PTS glucose transporter subunit IIA [Actinomycetaceae bacterium]|nr:PTS glucose transporter subunit IIA [Actinomycetaceae bacterium]
MWNPFKKKDDTSNEVGTQSPQAPATQAAATPTPEPAPAAPEPTPASPAAGGAGAEGLRAPVQGRLLPLDEVPDPVFAQRMMGDGFAVDPTSNVVCAPVAGELMMVAPTAHAFAIRTRAGAEILVHVGLDTVNLKGSGFRVLCEEGSQLEAGEPVIEVDWEVVRPIVPAVVTPVVLTNGDAFAMSEPNLAAGEGEDVVTITPRS